MGNMNSKRLWKPPVGYKLLRKGIEKVSSLAYTHTHTHKKKKEKKEKRAYKKYIDDTEVK